MPNGVTTRVFCVCRAFGPCHPCGDPPTWRCSPCMKAFHVAESLSMLRRLVGSPRPLSTAPCGLPDILAQLLVGFMGIDFSLTKRFALEFVITVVVASSYAPPLFLFSFPPYPLPLRFSLFCDLAYLFVLWPSPCCVSPRYRFLCGHGLPRPLLWLLRSDRWRSLRQALPLAGR